MATTDRDISALEHLAYRIREDTHGCATWDRQGTHVIFTRELKGKQLLYAIETVVAHASDPDAKTPAAITRPFTPKTGQPPSRPDEPTRDERCSTCFHSKTRCRQLFTDADHEFESIAAHQTRGPGARPEEVRTDA